MYLHDPLGTIEQLNDHSKIHSASLRPLYHSKRIETTRFVHIVDGVSVGGLNAVFVQFRCHWLSLGNAPADM